jgi:hypothetical protein
VDEWRWRQSDTATVARNFYLHGYRILHPQINWAGSAPGYVGTEFQLITFLAALLYSAVGIHEWVGRAISLIFYVSSVPFYYLLVRRVSSERAAFIALGIYTITPLGIFASRCFMPDIPSLCFSMMALYWFTKWLDRPTSGSWLMAAGLAASLAILVKPTAIIFGLPLLYMAWTKLGARLLGRLQLWIFAALALVPPVAWYVYAYFISVSNPPYHMFGGDGVKFMNCAFYWKIVVMTATMTLTPVLFASTLVGAFFRPKKEYSYVFHWWLVAILIFTVIVGYGNRHEWYRLVLVPVAAALTAIVWDSILGRAPKTAGIGLLALYFGGLAWLSFVWIKPKYDPWGQPLYEVGNELNRIAPPNALVIIADSGDPTAIFYSQRKGWHFLQNFGIPAKNSDHAVQELERLRSAGGQYLAFTRYTFWWLDYYKEFRAHLDARYKRIRETPDYVIYDLTGNTKS